MVAEDSDEHDVLTRGRAKRRGIRWIALFTGGLLQARTEQARAVYETAVANYRQTVLTGFQEVEDNLAALRILEREAATQEEAVKAAEASLVVTTNQYKAGVVGYLNVIVAQTAALASRRATLDILGRRMTAAVLLVKALGGGWDTSLLPEGHTPAAKK
ncbi:MAG: TolC family protein [Syntrophales bacterium]